jgi:ABC-type polysaccharide/polyol phosphate export permease
MGMYILLFSVILKIKIEGSADHIDFGFFLFCGMIPWLSFQESLSKSANIIIDFRVLIHQIKFPLTLLPLHIAISCAIQELITIILFFLLVLQFRETESVNILFMFLIFPLKVFLTTGFNLFLSSAAVFYRDIVQIIQIVLMCWFFSTPIVYPISRLPENLLFLSRLNPFSHIVNMYRYSIMSQGVWCWAGFFYTAFFAGSVYLGGLYYFRHRSKHFTNFL